MEKMTVVNGETPANAYFMNKLQDNIIDSFKSEETISDTDTYNCNYINSIIANGTGTNGYYTKFADGTMICYGVVNNVTTPAGNGASTLVTLPTSFINTDYNVSFTIVNGGAYWSNVSISVNSKNTSNFTLSTWNDAGYDNSNQSFSYIAIGKWK